MPKDSPKIERGDKIKFVGKALENYRDFNTAYQKSEYSLNINKVYTVLTPPRKKKIYGETRWYLDVRFPVRLYEGGKKSVCLKRPYQKINLFDHIVIVKRYTINDKIKELWKKSNYYKKYIKPKSTERKTKT